MFYYCIICKVSLFNQFDKVRFTSQILNIFYFHNSIADKFAAMICLLILAWKLDLHFNYDGFTQAVEGVTLFQSLL